MTLIPLLIMDLYQSHLGIQSKVGPSKLDHIYG